MFGELNGNHTLSNFSIVSGHQGQCGAFPGFSRFDCRISSPYLRGGEVLEVEFDADPLFPDNGGGNLGVVAPGSNTPDGPIPVPGPAPASGGGGTGTPGGGTPSGGGSQTPSVTGLPFNALKFGQFLNPRRATIDLSERRQGPIQVNRPW